MNVSERLATARQWRDELNAIFAPTRRYASATNGDIADLLVSLRLPMELCCFGFTVKLTLLPGGGFRISGNRPEEPPLPVQTATGEGDTWVKAVVALHDSLSKRLDSVIADLESLPGRHDQWILHRLRELQAGGDDALIISGPYLASGLALAPDDATAALKRLALAGMVSVTERDAGDDQSSEFEITAVVRRKAVAR